MTNISKPNSIQLHPNFEAHITSTSKKDSILRGKCYQSPILGIKHIRFKTKHPDIEFQATNITVTSNDMQKGSQIEVVKIRS